MSIEQWRQKIKEEFDIEISHQQAEKILAEWQQLSPAIKAKILAVAKQGAA